jgi:hypothetical protein
VVLAEKVYEPPLESVANIIVARKVEDGVAEGCLNLLKTMPWKFGKLTKLLKLL